MAYKIIEKEKVDNLLRNISKPEAVILEVWHQSRPLYYLKANTDKNPITENGGGYMIGRVSMNILDWYKWKEYDQPYTNLSRLQFGGFKDKGKKKKGADMDKFKGAVRLYPLLSR